MPDSVSLFLYNYTFAADGKSTLSVSVKADDINQGLFISTSPFTDWIFHLDQRLNQGVDLSRVTELTMKFFGMAIAPSVSAASPKPN